MSELCRLRQSERYEACDDVVTEGGDRTERNSFRRGAGDGNRTHATSLEGWDSTTELHPHRYYA